MPALESSFLCFDISTRAVPGGVPTILALLISLATSAAVAEPAAETGAEEQPLADPATETDTEERRVAALANDAMVAEARRRTDILLDYWLFSRAEIRRGYALLAERRGEDFVRYRTQFGVRVTSHFEHGWAAGVRVLARAGGYWNVGGETLEDVDLNLHEGYAFLSNRRMNVQVGRFEMAYGDQLVIGPVGFHHVGRTFDGARTSFELSGDGNAFLDVFGTKLREGSLFDRDGGERGPLGAGDLYLLGVYAALEGITPIPGAWDLYALPRVGAGEGVDVTFGTRLSGCAGVFCWRGETGIQAGRRPTTGATVSGAWQVDAELGVTTPAGVLHRAMLGGLHASGDDLSTSADNGWDQLYPTAHKWVGHMDLFIPRTNVSASTAAVALHITETLGASVKVFNFFIPEGSESGYYGTEVDAALRWELLPGLELFTEYGLFAPDRGDALHMLLVELSIRDLIDVW